MKFYRRKYLEESLEEPKGGPKGTHRDPEGSLARPPPRARRVPSLPPGPTPGVPLWPILPPGVKNLNIEEFRSFATTSWRKPIEKKKAISGGQIPPRQSPPGRGDHRHHHHHRDGHNRDHHQHHPQHQHHLHLHPISSHNCNLCCNPYYLSSLLCWC